MLVLGRKHGEIVCLFRHGVCLGTVSLVDTYKAYLGFDFPDSVVLAREELLSAEQRVAYKLYLDSK